MTDMSSTDALMATTSRWAMVVLGVLVFVRIRAVLDKEARPTWLATGCGFLALGTLGFVVPLPALDNALGGDNNAMLAEGIFATGAFWFMFCALGELAGRPIRRLAYLAPAALITGFTVLFFMITDRAGSSRDFIPERIGQTASWAAISVYFIGIGGISLASLWIVRKMTGRPYVLFRLGYTATTIAAMADISFMSLGHFSLGTAATRAPFWTTYVAFFYGSVLLLVAGFTTVYIWEKLRWRYYLYRIQPIHLRMKEDAQKRTTKVDVHDEPGVSSSLQETRGAKYLLSVLGKREPAYVVYQRVIAIRSIELYKRAELLDSEQEFVQRVEEALDELLDREPIPNFAETFETSTLTEEAL